MGWLRGLWEGDAMARVEWLPPGEYKATRAYRDRLVKAGRCIECRGERKGGTATRCKECADKVNNKIKEKRNGISARLDAE